MIFWILALLLVLGALRLRGRVGHYHHPYSLWSGSVVREPAEAALAAEAGERSAPRVPPWGRGCQKEH